MPEEEGGGPGASGHDPEAVYTYRTVTLYSAQHGGSCKSFVRMGSAQDIEVVKLLRGLLPANIHRSHTTQAGPRLTPLDERLDHHPRALGENFHGPVRQVPNPPQKTQPPSFRLCRPAETYTLHPARDRNAGPDAHLRLESFVLFHSQYDLTRCVRVSQLPI